MTERTPARAVNRSLARFFKLSIALGLVILVMPSFASAQATRTWVSGVGDDVNPCSRTAPCKTFAGAISKTANGGEINCLDPGGFGGVTITKSLTIDCEHSEGGVLVSGTNAIVVNAAATDSVILRGLDINGIGTGAQTSLGGIRVLQARRVKVFRTHIYRFRQGISVAPANPNLKMMVRNSEIEDNGVGVLNAPPSSGAGARVTVKNSTISGNGCGLVASNSGVVPTSAPATVDCGTTTSGGGTAFINAFNNDIIDNDDTDGASGSTGVYARGTGGVVRIGGNLITGNVHGLRTDVSVFGGIYSFGDNYIFANGTNGTPTGTVTPSRP